MVDNQEKTTQDTFYFVDDTQRNVTLEIFINAPEQTCSSTIKIDREVKIDGHSGSLKEQPLDTNHNLADKTLSIATTITNTAGHAAKASVTIRLKGGQSPSEDPLSATNEAGDSVTFIYTCKFFTA
jgi:hypothetical protein